MRRLGGFLGLGVIFAGLAGAGPAAAAAGQSCELLRAQYKSGFSSLVGEVRRKSPILLLRYAAIVGTGVPSKAEALGALSQIEPSCVESLGVAECARLIAQARAFINNSHRLNAAFGSAGCPGRIDG